MVTLGFVATGAAMLPFCAVPARASWGCLLISSALMYGCWYLLHQAYRLGDLSQVYPLERGAAPMLVAVGAVLVACQGTR